jgi:quercetin dioxygenase-like cupin family protein
MTQQIEARYGIDSYLDWVEREGLPVAEGLAIDLFAVETRPWARYGVKGAAIHCQGRGDYCNQILLDIPAGTGTSPQRHLYEELFYVLEGRGSTQLEFANGQKHSFEWGPRSMFAIPLNAKHRHFNGSGREHALLVSTTNMPMVINLYRNDDFVFDSDFSFTERMGKKGYYSGEGDLVMVRPGNHMWETNFVPDLTNIELQEWADRGAGATNIKLVLGDGTMHAHLSEMPPGTYKKGHRHVAGFHVMVVSGSGYSLMWYEGESDFQRIDWKHGMVFPPNDQQFHQHFTMSEGGARYLATAFGSFRYPMTAINKRTFLPPKDGEKQGSSRSIKEGGGQIEYEDQDPRIHRMWLDEMKKHNLTSHMGKYFPNPSS